MFDTLIVFVRSLYRVFNLKSFQYSIFLLVKLLNYKNSKFYKEILIYANSFFNVCSSYHLFHGLIGFQQVQKCDYKSFYWCYIDIIDTSYFYPLFHILNVTIKTLLLRHSLDMDFQSQVFVTLWTAFSLFLPEQRAIEARGGNLEMLSRLGLFMTYVWWKTEASAGAIVRPPEADRPARRRDERGERACSLFCRSTLIYCRRYFLVGASWRLPHHCARQWWARLTFCFELLPALARPVLSILPVRPLLCRARQCSILYCSIFILFCLFVFFIYIFFSRVIFRQPLALCCRVARRRHVSARISRLVVQIYNRDYTRNDRSSRRLGVRDKWDVDKRNTIRCCMCICTVMEWGPI